MEIQVTAGSVKLETRSIVYSGGELRVELAGIDTLRHEGPIMVMARLQSSEDIMRLLLLTEILERHGYIYHLCIPYLPYARQDRVTSENADFGMRTFSKITELFADSRGQTISYDVHSKDAADWMDENFTIIHQHEIILYFEALKPYLADCVLVSPDAGALGKTSSLSDMTGLDIIRCQKTRDPATGRLSDPVIENPELITGRKLLVVDDICDGGGTFIQLAKVLKQHNPADLRLYVTHGIFSRGLDVLTEHYSTIYTTDTFISPYHANPPDTLKIHAINPWSDL